MGKHAGGRPSKYDPKYCEEIIAFFSIPLKERVIKAVITGKNEYEKTEYEDRPNPLPTFAKYARKINTTVKTLLNWCEKHKEFLQAYNSCKDLQKEFLVDNGLAGLYPPASFIFTAKNITDMKDKTETEHSISGDLAELLKAGRERANGKNQ